ncbi:MAG: hypothetical protein KA515_02050 [Candidatus Pacebacteria bacterium]|jgi:hypothetical protein|nr:hypothetical protein [Candidatus Paceibacterota bacterium]
MKKINFAKFLQFGFMILLFLQTTETSAQEKLNNLKRLPPPNHVQDSINRVKNLENMEKRDTLFSFKLVDVVKVKTEISVNDVVTENTIYNSRVFKKTDYQFQNVFEAKNVPKKIELVDLVGVYVFSRRPSRDISIDYLFNSIDTSMSSAMNQSQIEEFCKLESVKKWFNRNKNGEIYFVVICDIPSEIKDGNGDIINNVVDNKVGNKDKPKYYMAYKTNFVKVTKYGSGLAAEYCKRGANKKIEKTTPVLFILPNP